MTQPTDDIKLLTVEQIDAAFENEGWSPCEGYIPVAHAIARAAVLEDRERSGHQKYFGDLLEERSKVGILQSALETIAKYPSTRSDEIGYAGCRRIAREALDAAMAKEAQQ